MDTKIVFNCSPVFPHVYTGTQQCYKTSLDPDTWHWTGLALEAQPPVTAANQIAAANADFTDWVVIADYVGFKYWLADGSEHVITEYGVSPPTDALTEKPEIQPPPKTQYSPLDFLDLFTEQEQLAVVAATRESDPIKLWYDKMLASSFVDLNDPRTSSGLTALVDAGLIPQARYDQIMGTVAS